MKLQEINKGLKCPNCKQWRLRPFHYTASMYYAEAKEGRGAHDIHSFFRCINCYAEYQEEKK